jgi:hypothetical protein
MINGRGKWIKLMEMHVTNVSTRKGPSGLVPRQWMMLAGCDMHHC